MANNYFILTLRLAKVSCLPPCATVFWGLTEQGLLLCAREKVEKRGSPMVLCLLPVNPAPEKLLRQHHPAQARNGRRILCYAIHIGPNTHFRASLAAAFLFFIFSCSVKTIYLYTYIRAMLMVIYDLSEVTQSISMLWKPFIFLLLPHWCDTWENHIH